MAANCSAAPDKVLRTPNPNPTHSGAFVGLGLADWELMWPQSGSGSLPDGRGGIFC